MVALLIAEEGVLVGTKIPLTEEDEWILGRDPDVCFLVLEDPMVSRKHVLIRKQDESYFIENLSSTNPVMVNGEDVLDPVELQENDMVQIGSTTFRFTLTPEEGNSSPEEGETTNAVPAEEAPQSPLDAIEADESIDLGTLTFTSDIQSRWMVKVVAGPNTGAEFPIREGQTYLLGKDPNSADILFQDLSVSRQHAKLHCSEDSVVSIEDLGSRNGVLINGSLGEETTPLKSQDLVALGTTSFLVIDREQMRETIYSPPTMTRYADHELSEEEKKAEEEKSQELEEELTMKRNWKATFIPFRHLMIGALVVLIVFSGVIATLSLFSTKPIEIAKRDEQSELKKLLKDFPKVQFTYDDQTGKLFLIGHVLSDVEYQEMLYLLKSQKNIQSIDDNVVIDELVWENQNALLYRNPEWRSILITGIKPGEFVVKGYLPTMDEKTKLDDYINRNFPYLDRLKNEVVVDNNLETNVRTLLAERDFANVTFQFSNGEFVFTGRADHKREAEFTRLMAEVDALPGVRQIKNYVIFTSVSSARINITSRFSVTGTSKYGNENQFVLINGKILSVGDSLDGMTITAINPQSIFLEKGGIKYTIDYNLQ